MDHALNDSRFDWKGRKAHLVTQPFALAVSQSAIPTILADTSLDDVPIVFANPSFLRLTGWDEDEVLGRNLRFLNGMKTDPHVAQGVEAAIAAKEEVSVDMRLDRKDGRGFWARLDVAPLFDPDGRAVLLVATLVDVTDRVRATRGLREAEARFEARVDERTAALEAALERTELLSREVTHRTKNALALLAALIDAKRRRARDPREAEILADVSRRVRAIGRLQGFLEEVQSEEDRIDLEPFLRDLVAELDAPTDIRLVFEGAPPARLTASSALAVALCVSELVLNAEKHAFPAGRGGTIRVGASASGASIVLTVSDDGIGLPDGFAPEACDGLGMLVILDQTRKLRGEVSCGASPEGGARFAVTFPN
jgi:PAS domain S-box-containing protein